MVQLPPLPARYEAHFYRTYDRICEIAEKLKAKRLLEGRRPIQAAKSSGLASRIDLTKPKELFEMMIPSTRAGLVIGVQGETLRKIEKLSFTSIKPDINSNIEVNGVSHKRFTISGTAESIEEAKRLIYERLENTGIDASYSTIYVPVPNSRIGLVIGKGGETIREIQERSGAKVQVMQENVAETTGAERYVSIMGEPDNVELAKQMVNDLVYNASRPGSYAPSLLAGSKGAHSITIEVPESAIGCLIGRRAENLKQMQSASATRIFVDTGPHATGLMRIVTISGATSESVLYAQQLIEERVNAHITIIHGSLALDPNQPGFVYQSPNEIVGLSAPVPHSEHYNVVEKK